MPDDPREQRITGPLVWVLAPFGFIGAWTLAALEQIGIKVNLLREVLDWIWKIFARRKVRFGKRALISQIVRVGVRSVFIVSLVSGAVGLILALQLTPALDEFGRRDLVANIIGVAVFRELGPLIGAIVLTGFAGAAIAAEIGTMVVSEEVEALQASALNPVRFLVMPRVIATTAAMTVLGILSSFVAVSASLAVSITALDIPYDTYMNNMLAQTKLIDFLTGVFKGGVFGLLIGVISCANGLQVTGGAKGVGDATTYTVVQCVVAIVIADLVFTTIFFALKLF